MELYTRLQAVTAGFQAACADAPAVEPATVVAWAATAAQELADVAARLDGWPPGSRVPPLGLKDTARLAGVLDVLLATCALGQIDASSGDAPGARWVRTHAKALAAHGVTGDALLAGAVASGDDAAVRAQLAAAAVDAAALILVSPWVDRRMKDRGLPDVLAAVFQLQRWGATGAGGPAADTAAATAARVLARLRAALPMRVLAAALLQLVWGQVTANCVLAAPAAATAGAPAAATAAVVLWDPVAAPSSSSPPAAGLPDWLTLCAGAELARILMMTSTATPAAEAPAAPDAAAAAARDDGDAGGISGVEAVLDCVFDAVDLANPVAVDRAVLAAASIVATPPVEVAGSAGAYLSAVAPQLLRLLRTGGHRSDLLVTTASLALARIIAGGSGGAAAASAASSSREQWRAALEHVLKPLARPLVAYGEPPPLPVSTSAAAPVQSSSSPSAAAAEVGGTDRPARRRPLITVVGEDAPAAPGAQQQQQHTTPARPAPAAAVVTLADADAVMGSVADLHRVLFISWPPPRPAASLLFAVPALLDMLAMMMQTAAAVAPTSLLQPPPPELQAAAASIGEAPPVAAPASVDAPAPSTGVLLVRQVAARILAAAPHGWAVATLLRYAGLDDMLPSLPRHQPQQPTRASAARVGGGGSDDGDDDLATAPAVRTRHRRVRLVPAGYGGPASASGGGAPSLLLNRAISSAAEPPASFALVADTAPASDDDAAGWDDDVALSATAGGGVGGGDSGSDVQSLLASLQQSSAAALADGALLLSTAHARRVAAVVDVLGTMPSTGTATHKRRRRPEGTTPGRPSVDGASLDVDSSGGLSTLSVAGDLLIRLLRRYTRDQLAMLAGDADDGDDSDAPSPVGAVRCLQLLIALTERLGPSLLVGRSPSAVLLLVRSLRPLLAMVTGALRLPLPDPVVAGAGGPGSLPVRIAAREDAPLRVQQAQAAETATERAPPAAAVDDPLLHEVASLLLSLLTAAGQQVMADTTPALAAAGAVAVAGDDADDDELVDVDAQGLSSLSGTARRVVPPPSTARGLPALPDADTIAAQAWLLSCLPLVTAIANATSGGRAAAPAASLALPLDGDGDGDAGSSGPDDLRHAALALRYLLLSLPPLPTDEGSSGVGNPRANRPPPATTATATAAAGGDSGSGGDAAFHRALQAALDLCGNVTSPPLVAHGLRRLVRLVAVGPRQLDERRDRQLQQQQSASATDGGATAASHLLEQLFGAAVTALRGGAAAGAELLQPVGAANNNAPTQAPDAFVAVAAVELLTVLAARHATSQLPRLVRLCCGDGDGDAGGADEDGATPDHVRLRAGEALAGAVRSLGAGRLLPAHVDVLLPPLAAVGVRGWNRQQSLAAQLEVTAAAAQPSASDAARGVGDASADRVELTYAQVEQLAAGSVPAALAAMARGDGGGGGSAAGDAAAAAAAAATRYRLASRLSAWADVRASCLSVLGDVAGGLGGAALLAPAASRAAWSPSRLLEGLAGVLTHEVVVAPPPHGASNSAGSDTDAARALTANCATRVRRAAALALRLTLDGLGEAAPAATAGGSGGGGATDAGVLSAVLPATTACLRAAAAGDPDAVTRGHASDALSAANDLLRRSLQGPSGGNRGSGGGGGGGALLGGLRLPPPAGAPPLVVAAPGLTVRSSTRSAAVG